MTAAVVRTASRRLDPQALRAAWWTLQELGRVRRELKTGSIEEVRVSAPPALASHALRGVEAVLRRRPHSCLEESLLLQRWHADHGRPLDVVIGVAAPTGDFRAHAWLEGTPVSEHFDELVRLRP